MDDSCRTPTSKWRHMWALMWSFLWGEQMQIFISIWAVNILNLHCSKRFWILALIWWGDCLWHDDGGTVQNGWREPRGGYASGLQDLFHHHHLSLRRVTLSESTRFSDFKALTIRDRFINCFEMFRDVQHFLTIFSLDATRDLDLLWHVWMPILSHFAHFEFRQAMKPPNPVQHHYRKILVHIDQLFGIFRALVAGTLYFSFLHIELLPPQAFVQTIEHLGSD